MRRKKKRKMSEVIICKGRPSSAEGRDPLEMKVYDVLDGLGIEYETATHAPAFNMEACAEVERKLGVDICKNLFLCNRQQTDFYMLMLPGPKVFKTKYISSQLGCSRLSFGTDERMTELLGIHPGSVTVLALINDSEKKVRLAIDKDLLADEFIGCHPCFNTSTVKIRVKDIIEKFLPYAGHVPTIVELPWLSPSES